MVPGIRVPALRGRDGHHARVTYEELFFDLVYVFAVTQLSHHLLHHLGVLGMLQTLVLWFAVWLGWQYACWVSNWFDPQAPRIRGLLFTTMLLALLMSSSMRCQLFVIVALGETLLATGGVLSEAGSWNGDIVSAVLANFAGTLAMWWLYFGTSSQDATDTITRSADPGRIGACFHYVHALLIAGIIATAVGNDLVMDAPEEGVSLAHAAMLVAGPLIYLLGSALYKRVVYGRMPRSHLLGAVLLLVMGPLLPMTHLLAAGWLTSVVLLLVGLVDTRTQRQTV